MTDKELSVQIDIYFKEVFNSNCPIHNFVPDANHRNIKICQDCADDLEFAGDIEVELVKQYCNN